MLYFCCDDWRRRNEIDGRADVNGIDFLEVLDDPNATGEARKLRQRVLFVHFINDPAGFMVAKEDLAIEGGERIHDIRVESADLKVDPRSGSSRPVLVVTVDRPGDFSTYTLRLLPKDSARLRGLDPVLRAVDFSFKVNCATTFDPLEQPQRAPETRDEPARDYLARDYLSLRQMMLDRLAVLLPDWRERTPADLGITLVELLAYVGDQLSYRQDAVATEAYLGTCRLRASARRHARLVDYFMHDGCNARTWVQVRLKDGTSPFELKQATFYSMVSGLPPRIVPNSREDQYAKDSSAAAFQLIPHCLPEGKPLLLHPEHNQIRFYTWGSRQCCLPAGAVRATLRGNLTGLTPGMVLVFVERLSPRTGDPDDVDLGHRHAVLLTAVDFAADPLGKAFDEPPANGDVPVTEIRWADEDALPFPLCISAETAPEYGGAFVADVSVALGNIVLADHGAWVEEELGDATADTLRLVRDGSTDSLAEIAAGQQDDRRCRDDRAVLARARFRPRLALGPLTQAVPLDPKQPLPSAHDAMGYRAKDAVPAIWLRDRLAGSLDEAKGEMPLIAGCEGAGAPSSEDPTKQQTAWWRPRLDLLRSRTVDKHFVVEVEADGRGRVRFGDGTHGARPQAGRAFTARYRVGNGLAGNVGADTLMHIVSDEGSITGVSNPLPAGGGVEMETVEEVRQYAPFAFRPQTMPGQSLLPDGKTLERAVTPADYAALLETSPEVQRAMATFRWTGSWRTMSLTVDRRGGGQVDAPFEDTLRQRIERYRLAGHDVEIEPPRPVALEVTLRVRIKAGYFTSQVRRTLLDIFSNRFLPDGRRGLFHPDNLTFGQTIYLSALYTGAQLVDGVEWVDITRFQRRDRPGTTARDEGRLVLGRLEIARLDNDPNFPERGMLDLILEGGR